MLRFLLFVFLLSSCGVLSKKIVDNNKDNAIETKEKIVSKFSRKDSLRGFLFPERSCFDVLRYDLYVSVFPERKFIKGYNDITFHVVNNTDKIQLELYDNMNIDRIDYIHEEKGIHKVIHSIDSITTDNNFYYREHNSLFISFTESLIASASKHTVRIYYNGIPIEAERPPWDGGFSWDKDDNGQDWIAVSCQGIGASVWWPNKDHQSDEPDEGMTISVETPSDLIAISNGNLKDQIDLDSNRKIYVWEVTYPINNYNVTLNIGDYVDFYDYYISEDSSKLDLSYYVMSYNIDKAKKHFEVVKPMLSCFEKYFGEYPFKKDGYSLVETPYLGMEHQSAIAYGNNYLYGYNGNTNFTAGLEFDYIIIHETGHEWWGNSITSNDIADMWIHEGFCTYSEVIFVECYYGREAMLNYVAKQRKSIGNKKPIQGVYGVQSQGSGDMYSKFSFILHTIRSIVDNDDKFFELIKNIYQTFKYKNIDGVDIINYISDFMKKNINKERYYGNMNVFFEQYLENASIPVLDYEIDNKSFSYKWNAIDNFDMPLKISLNGENIWIYPTNEWKKMKISIKDKVEIIEEDFLIDIKKVN